MPPFLTGFNFIAGVIFLMTLLAWICLIGYVIPRMEVSGKSKFYMILFAALLAIESFAAAGLAITGSVRVVEGGEAWAWFLIAVSLLVLTAMWGCFWDFVHYWWFRRLLTRRRSSDDDS